MTYVPVVLYASDSTLCVGHVPYPRPILLTECFPNIDESGLCNCIWKSRRVSGRRGGGGNRVRKQQRIMGKGDHGFDWLSYERASGVNYSTTLT